ncbi:MAG TPA: pilus assembly protein N-terminal domain-containing protein [Caulobacteraceae bacterium]|jgi:hypothetical protein
MPQLNPRTLFAAAGAAAVVTAAAPAFAAGTVNVRIDEVTPVSLGGAAAHVVVGNPAVADVNMLDQRKLLILGRSYGVTNVLVIDRAGRTIYSAQVNVTPGEIGKASLFRGPLIQNYACASRCERQPMPGEVRDPVYQYYSEPVKDYAERAAKGAEKAASSSNP